VTFDTDGKLILREYREVYTRNEIGAVIKKVTYNGDGSMKEKESTTYQYDERGNWIQSIDLQCDVTNDELPCKPTRIDYRGITYHSETGRERSEQNTLP